MKSRLVVSLLFLSWLLNGQANFVAGKIVTKNGETIQGEIDYREWIFNPRTIKFRKSATDTPESYKPLDLQSFFIDYKKEKYISADVFVNNESLDWDEVREYDSVDDVEDYIKLDPDTVFLLTLVEGTVDLYQLLDENNKLHYFIQRGNGPIEELLYRRVKAFKRDAIITENTGSTYLVRMEIETYKRQLSFVMQDCPEVAKRTQKLKYSYEVFNLVKRFNNCIGRLEYVKPKDKAPSFLFAWAGVAQSSFVLQDRRLNPPISSLPASRAELYGIGFEWKIARTRNKVSLIVEGNYLQGESTESTNFMVAGQTNKMVEYHTAIEGFRFSGLFKYGFFDANLQPYLKAGISATRYTRNDFWVIDRSDEVIRNDQTLNEGEVALIGGLGLQYKNFFMEGRYISGNDINKTTDYDLKMNRLALLFAYALKLNKY